MSDERTKIEPAMTAEDWDFWMGPERDLLPLGDFTDDQFGHPHAIAARCLYGQPFGFSWEYVDEIREIATEERSWIGDNGYFPDPFLSELADKIAALLPPREKSQPKEDGCGK